jgi:O-antigen ligase
VVAVATPDDLVDSVPSQLRTSRVTRLAGYFTVLGIGLMIGAVGFGHAADPFAFSFAILVCVASAILLRPVLGVYFAVFFTIIGDSSTMDWYPFTANFSSAQSILHIQDRLTFSPLEVCLALTVVGWFLHAAGPRRYRIEGRPVLFPMLALGAFVVVGLFYGLVVQGGDQQAAFWEFRPLVYLVAVYVLASTLFTRPAQYVRLAWLVVGAITVQSLFALDFYYQLSPSQRSSLEALTDHPSSLVYAWMLLLALSLWILKGCTTRARILVTLAAVPTTWVFFLSQRRAAMVGLIAGFLVLSVVVFFRRRRAFMAVVPLVLLLTAGYTVAFWNTTTGVGFGAQAVKTVIAPDSVSERDRSSDLYRAIENYDLAYTLRAEPLTGVGFGKPFYRPIPLPDISFFVFYEYIPHNTIVWVWLKLGYFGFISMLVMFATTIRAGTRAALRVPSGNTLAVALGALTAVVMFILFAYVDIAFTPQSSVFLAVAVATCGNMMRVGGYDEAPTPRRARPIHRRPSRASGPRPADTDSSTLVAP